MYFWEMCSTVGQSYYHVSRVAKCYFLRVQKTLLPDPFCYNILDANSKGPFGLIIQQDSCPYLVVEIILGALCNCDDL